MILRFGLALREDEGRLGKPGTGTGFGRRVQKSIVIMWVFSLPEDMGERCEKAVAG